MAWLTAFLAKYPELGVYLALGIGYWIGTRKIAGFTLGGVTGSLLAGMLIGFLFHVPVSGTAKSVHGLRRSRHRHVEQEADQHAGQQRAGDAAEGEACDLARADPVTDAEREVHAELGILGEESRQPRHVGTWRVNGGSGRPRRP